MALDDPEKRKAVMGVGRPWMRVVEPVATPDEEWRISVGNAYGGNPLAAVATALKRQWAVPYWFRSYNG